MQRDEIIEEIFSITETVSHFWRDYFFTILNKSDINFTQLRVMILLKAEQPMLGKNLAKRLQLTPSSITQTLENLAQKQYIVRKQDKDDRRNVYITLSASGEAILDDLRQKRLKILTMMNQPLTDAELQAELSRQRKVLTHLQSIRSSKAQ